MPFSATRLARFVRGAGRLLSNRYREVARLREELAARDRQIAELTEHGHKLDAALQHLDRRYRSADYNSDGLMVYNKDVAFLRDERFMSAYRRGVHSGHKLGRGAGGDIHIEWRAHVACWAATRACALPGAFVECGVNTGVLSLAVCEYIDFNATGKDFYLFDTFAGIPESQMCDAERTTQGSKNIELYEECYEVARANFAPYHRTHLMRGLVPDTLPSVKIDQVCYLSIDMNIVYPEIAALEYFWDKLVPGAAVLFDDYGWKSHYLQKQAIDEFGASKGVPILLLPTGQGLIIKM
jgi:O-methyltransferase